MLFAFSQTPFIAEDPMNLTKDEMLSAYTTIRRHEEQLKDVSLATIALVSSLRDVLPGFAEAYERHHAAAVRTEEGQGYDDLLRLFDALIQQIQRRS
jgi:hypothetical protein